MTCKLILHGLVVFLLLTAATPASRKLMADKKTSSVTYTMHHPLHTWDGVSHDVNCALLYNDDNKQIESVAVAIKIASFDSGDANRDSHALEVLDGIRYPNVTFVGLRVQPNSDGTLTATGKLTFHGVTKPETMIFTRKDETNSLLITGAFDINMTEFGVERPSLLGMKADDTIKLKFSASFVR